MIYSTNMKDYDKSSRSNSQHVQQKIKLSNPPKPSTHTNIDEEDTSSYS